MPRKAGLRDCRAGVAPAHGQAASSRRRWPKKQKGRIPLHGSVRAAGTACTPICFSQSIIHKCLAISFDSVQIEFTFEGYACSER
ncbi:hypothetical protein B8V81_1100 [Paenibacillus pasadenensis]|uniref:Uncharacterized protein n=1 Tax=Paenibacillus pasadenensis TaxID=217090 RepID=A0A2N5N943_9BACL|nr:hypothetical protein B8V81_1100 [Paenibacillus pasadenensis]